MNEINWIRSFRSDIAPVGAEGSHRARTKLLEVVGGQTEVDGGRRRRVPRRAALAVAIAICAPAGYALADGVGIGGEDHPPAPAPGVQPGALAPAELPPGFSEQDRRDLMPTDPSLIPEGGAGEGSSTSRESGR